MIEEKKEYTTISGQEVMIDKNISHDKGVMAYSKEMLETLWIKNPWWEERKHTMKEQEVFIGKTNNINMPIGYWHKQSGKCLWLSKWDKVDPKLNIYKSNFDILDRQKNQ